MKKNFIPKSKDNEINDKKLDPNFGFNTMEKLKHPNAICSTSDSAYNSMVCSPFSPVVLSYSSTTKSSTYQEGDEPTKSSISPFLESDEHDDVFNVSLENICKDETYKSPEIRTSRSNLSNVTFRPISTENKKEKFNDIIEKSSSNVQIANFHDKNSLMSQRSISTQTKLSMNYIATYRPNSAPLQEGIEEELSEINKDALSSIRYRIHRNSTSHSIRSPMPDLILPTVSNNNDLASRLSLIADQIDENIKSPTNIIRNSRRTRRFSTSLIADMTPEGSWLDLLVSIYNAFDNTLPRDTARQRTTSSVSNHD